MLAIAGVYGVMAYAVGRRTAEIGVRMAMGASAGDILRLVIGQGLRLAVTGIAIDCVLAYGLAQLLRGMLFAVAPADLLVFIAVPLALMEREPFRRACYDSLDPSSRKYFVMMISIRSWPHSDTMLP